MIEKVEIIKKVEKKVKNGEYKQALGEITKCLELYPNFIVAKVLKAECLLNLDNVDEALALANEVLFSAPDNIKARKIAIEANLRAGNFEEAKSHVDFLSFLLPVNHPYLEEITQKIRETESGSQVISESVEKAEEKENIVKDLSEEDTKTYVGISGEVDAEKELEKDVQIEQPEKTSVEEVSHKASSPDVEEQANKVKEKVEQEIREEIITDEEQDFLIHEESVDLPVEVEDAKEQEDVESIEKEDIVTGVLPEQISTITLPDKREEPEIKTRTLALIYERQGMLNEALEILENLYSENEDYELLNDIERIKAKLKGGDNSEYVMKKIKKLEDWLERVKWHSSV